MFPVPHLATKFLFLDTQAYEAVNFGFRSKAFIELIRHIEAGRLSLVLTTITKAEVEARIRARILEATLPLEKFRNKARSLRYLKQFERSFEPFDPSVCAAEIIRDFDDFLRETNASVIDLGLVNSEEVFIEYFRGSPPFDNAKKKSEFPDAFAQHALVSWCKASAARIYVVSGDGDWLSLSGETETLLPTEKLEEIIDLALKDEAAAQAERALLIFQKHWPEVKAAIEKEFLEGTFYVGNEDGWVNSIDLRDILFTDPAILQVSDVSATFAVSAEVEYQAEVTFEDYANGLWDDDTDQWLILPTKDMAVDESDSFTADVLLTFDQESPALESIICSIANEFSVTVKPTDWELE